MLEKQAIWYYHVLMNIERNHIYNSDCMLGMAEMPDNFIDLAIVDPPYGIGNFIQVTGKVSKDFKEVKWNNEPPPREYFYELRRISKHQIIWGANNYNCFTTGGAIVWYKGEQSGKVSACEIASHTFYKKCDFVHINWQSGFYRRIYENIIHPCQKPAKLYKWLLSNYAKEGDLILDTHMGSGSSYIAALDLGFDYIGFEIDADYFAAIEDRVYHFTRQRSLL